MESVAQRRERIKEKIAEAALRSGRNPESVQIVAVTKTVPVERIAEAVQAGIRIFGENYIQESREKMSLLPFPEISWHFIGRLQSNKAKHAVLYFDLIHSVHSEKLALAINRQAEKINRVQPVLIQVNTGGESAKNGVPPEEAMALVRRMSRLENISVRGLMTMPPFFDAPEKVRPFFRTLYDLKQKITDAGMENISMEHLSMGMSGDFEVAVEEGATLVRIGTALFGKRI